jgi:hypothetical protein
MVVNMRRALKLTEDSGWRFGQRSHTNYSNSRWAGQFAYLGAACACNFPSLMLRMVGPVELHKFNIAVAKIASFLKFKWTVKGRFDVDGVLLRTITLLDFASLIQMYSK